jgi:alkylation response protein AidB-like acyl-CoA dehydrogenase
MPDSLAAGRTAGTPRHTLAARRRERTLADAAQHHPRRFRPAPRRRPADRGGAAGPRHGARVRADRIMPHIADWFEAGTLPRELIPELGKLGLLGMHLTATAAPAWARSPTASPAARWRRPTPGCAAWSRCRARWPCSRSGNTARGAEERVAAPDGGRRGDRLLRPHRARSRERPGRHGNPRDFDGHDWVLSGTKMWITNGSIADIAVVWADPGRHPRLPGTARGARLHLAEHPQEDVAARLGHLGAAPRRGPAAGGLRAARRDRAEGAAVLPVGS